jgi:hypothetical protein
MKCKSCGANLSDVDHIVHDPDDELLIDNDGSVLNMDSDKISHSCLKCSEEDVIVTLDEFNHP